MKLEDLVEGKSYKINKPEDVDVAPCWDEGDLDEGMDYLDNFTFTYHPKMKIQDSVNLDINGSWAICPSWLTEVESEEDLGYLACVKDAYYFEEEGGERFGTRGKIYPVSLYQHNVYYWTNDLNTRHNWPIIDYEFWEHYVYCTSKEKCNIVLSKLEEPTSFTHVTEEDIDCGKEWLKEEMKEDSKCSDITIEISEVDISPSNVWTDEHYNFIYKHPVTRGDSDEGFVEIKVDPYFVNKVWKLSSKDDTGGLFHQLKTIARFTDKNTVERELRALNGQVKRMAELYEVEL